MRSGDIHDIWFKEDIGSSVAFHLEKSDGEAGKGQRYMCIHMFMYMHIFSKQLLL